MSSSHFPEFSERIEIQQRDRNQRTRGEWANYSHHRQKISDLLARFAPANRILCLGAGNCNDLELKTLLSAFDELVLVDIDRTALQEGVEAQAAAGDSRVLLLGGVNLLEPADLPKSPLVVSLTCLSQLIEAVSQLATAKSLPWEEVASKCLDARTQHVGQLIEWTTLGGNFVLISDFVSSDTLPELAAMSDDQIAGHASDWFRSGNFFTGLNPFAIKRMLETDEAFVNKVDSIRITKPWRWQVGQRAYAVAAIVGRRTDAIQNS
ncbi:MAG: hypothetical protein R3C28_06160 [Pirellulaceae bacterium]